jgi:hypothetical protein
LLQQHTGRLVNLPQRNRVFTREIGQHRGVRRSALTWILRLLSSTKTFGQTLAINSSFETTRPAFLTRTKRISNARLPSRICFPPFSSSRWPGNSWNSPNAKAFSPLGVAWASVAAEIV